MQWLSQWRTALAWPRTRSMAWGAVLGDGCIVVAALSATRADGVRVLACHRMQVPPGLLSPGLDGAGWAAHLQTMGQGVPRAQRLLALAAPPALCLQGQITHQPQPGQRWRHADGQAMAHLEAAAAWGLDADEVGFDFALSPSQAFAQTSLNAPPHAPSQPSVAAQGAAQHLQWAASPRVHLDHWAAHTAAAGWQLAVVEPVSQSLARATAHWHGPRQMQMTDPAQDWQFVRQPKTHVHPSTAPPQGAQGDDPWPFLACGAALGLLC